MKKLLIALLVVVPFAAYAAFDTNVGTQVPVYTGTNATSTVVTAYTLISQDVVGYSTIDLTPNTGSLTLTLPASSTMSTWLPSEGNRLTILLVNATTTPGVNIITAAGTGSLISNASTTLVIGPQKAMLLNVDRKPNTDLLWITVPSI